MLRLFFCCLAICFSYNIALAKYCVKLPSCEELGYVFPYKEGRRQIRCPFDTDKVLYLDYCQAYGIQGKPDEKAGEYQECIEEKADGTKINTGYYRYTRCNVGYVYKSGSCIGSPCSGYENATNEIANCATVGECQKGTTTVYKCDACVEGYEANANNSECIQTCNYTSSNKPANCVEASSCRLAGVEYFDTTCTKCTSDYELNGSGGCVAKCAYTSTSLPTYCKVADSCSKNSTTYYANSCTTCNDGYTLNGGVCSRKKYAVGDIYKYNGTAIGVVFYDDGSVTKVVALKDINSSGIESSATGMYWSTSSSGTYSYDVTGLTNYSSSTDAEKDMDGKSNTSAILSYIASKGYTAQAATATSLYAPSVCGSGTMCTKGNWYLPALGELVTIYNNLSKIQSSISSAGGTQISTSNYYWSSTEYGSTGAWRLGFYSGGRYASTKCSSGYVRPVLAF